MSAKINDLKEELHRTKSELKEKKKELKSFKDRLAKDMTLTINTGKTQSMNNPVNKTRLIEMYEEILRQWPKIKKHLKSKNKDIISVENDIKELFKDATNQMKQKKKQIDELFGLNEQSSEMVTEKVQVYRQSTIQYLQLAHFHKGAGLKDCFPEDETENPENVMRYFFSHCHWMSCLMALNSPPLEPDWNNHDTGMDRWNIFPRKLIPVRR